MNVKLTEKELKDIKERIFAGKENLSAIAKSHDIRPSTVSYYARKWGGSARFFSKKPLIWNAAKIDKFLIEHNSTIRRISQNIINVKHPLWWQCSLCLHSWEQTFDSISKRIQSSPYGCDACGKNEYSVYNHFLDGLTPISAYFMGVYFAKGTYNMTPKGMFSNIQISSKDKDKLERLSNIIFSTYPVEKNGNIYRIRIKSKQFYDKLLEYNALQKNHIPKIIPPNLVTHFIRGYVDFTGHFNVTYPEETIGHVHNYGCRFNLSGNVKFMTELQKEYKKYVSDKYRTNKRYTASTRTTEVQGYLQIGHNSKKKAELHLSGLYNPFCFMEWLYNSEIVPLKYVSGSRYNTFLFLKQQVNQKNETKDYINKKSKQYKELRKEWHKSLTFTQISKKYGITFDQVKKISTKESASVNPEVKAEILEKLNRKRHLQKLMNEIITRVEHKTGMKKSTFVTHS